MTDSQRITVRLSECRQRLNELLGVETRSDEQQAELEKLTGEVQTLEPELRAAIAAEPDPHVETRPNGEPATDPETRERLALRGRARVGDFLAGFLNQGPVEGASAEYRAAMGLQGYEIPLDLFEPPPETRAATAAPASGTPIGPRPVQPYIYSRKQAGFLGIDMPVVTGTAAFPVLTTTTPSSMKAKGGAADETAAAITISTSTPKRATGSFRVRYEDIAQMPALEDALRRDIPLSIADEVDQQVVAGNGTAPNVNGLFNRLTDPTAMAAEATFATYVSRIFGEVDGRFADSEADLRLLIGIDTLTHAAGKFAATDSPVNVPAWARASLGGFRAAATSWIAAKSSNNQQALVRLGMRPMMAVCPVWGGVRLIRDEYSSAAKGEIVVTAMQLLGDVHVLQSGSFVQTSFKLG